MELVRSIIGSSRSIQNRRRASTRTTGIESPAPSKFIMRRADKLVGGTASTVSMTRYSTYLKLVWIVSESSCTIESTGAATS